MIESMLTTIDNPYDPFEDFPPWYAFDSAAGYHTPSFLARIIQNSDELSPADQALENEWAIDEIVRENVSGLYKKVTREVPEIEYEDFGLV